MNGARVLGVAVVLSIGCRSAAGPAGVIMPPDASVCDGAATSAVLMLLPESPLDAVAAVVVTLADGAGGMRALALQHDPSVPITPTAPAQVMIPLADGTTGTLFASLEARDATACTVAEGTAAFSVVPCGRVTVAVSLRSVVGCGG